MVLAAPGQADTVKVFQMCMGCFRISGVSVGAATLECQLQLLVCHSVYSLGGAMQVSFLYHRTMQQFHL